eukprot:SAG31_NODE_623_length_13492_cov_62.118196_1_plen_115_part_00
MHRTAAIDCGSAEDKRTLVHLAVHRSQAEEHSDAAQQHVHVVRRSRAREGISPTALDAGTDSSDLAAQRSICHITVPAAAAVRPSAPWPRILCSCDMAMELEWRSAVRNTLRTY